MDIVADGDTDVAQCPWQVLCVPGECVVAGGAVMWHSDSGRSCVCCG